MAEPLPAGKPFTLQVVHDGLNTTSYRLTENGAVVAQVPYAPAGVAFPFASGLPSGSYDFTVTAVGPGGEATSAVLTVQVIVAAPSQPGLVIVVG